MKLIAPFVLTDYQYAVNPTSFQLSFPLEKQSSLQ